MSPNIIEREGERNSPITRPLGTAAHPYLPDCPVYRPAEGHNQGEAGVPAVLTSQGEVNDKQWSDLVSEMLDPPAILRAIGMPEDSQPSIFDHPTGAEDVVSVITREINVPLPTKKTREGVGWRLIRVSRTLRCEFPAAAPIVVSGTTDQLDEVCN